MIASPWLRKFSLTAHITISVGWMGSVAAFLALALVGLLGGNHDVVRATYLAMQPLAWYVILPLSFASLGSGLIQAFSTHWGLVRHYWVGAKLLINVFATIVLLMYMPTLDYLARLASEATSQADVAALRNPSPVLHSAAALILLLMATTLSVFKPKGVTRYGWRRQSEERALSRT